MNVLIVT